jgi:hypothetical protein
MVPQTKEKIARYALSIVCFTAYLFLFLAVMANAFHTSVSHFILS